MVWWEALTALQRIFALLAVPATLLLLVQTALLLLGMSGHGDSDTDVDTDGDGIPDHLDFDHDGHVDFDHDGHADFGHDGHMDDCAQLGHDHDPGHTHGHGVFHTHDHNGDGVPDHSLRLFSLRTIVAFFAIFGWTGIVLTKSGLGEGVSGVLAFFAGGLAMVLLAWLLKLALDLQSEGNIDPRNAIGREGTVYLTVPPRRSGAGKVTVLVQGRYIELDAVTDHAVPIPTGTAVMVCSAAQDFILTVEPIEKNMELGGT